MTLFGCNMLKCVSMNNQECKIGPERTVFVIINNVAIMMNADINVKN